MTTEIQIPVHRTTDETIGGIQWNRAFFLKRQPRGRM